MDQTSLNIFAECETLAQCVLLIQMCMNSHEKGFAFSSVIHFHLKYPRNTSMTVVPAAGHLALADLWNHIPETAVNSSQSFPFIATCHLGSCSFSVAWDLDSSVTSRCIWILDTPDMDLVSCIACDSKPDFECLTTDSLWYFYTRHESLVFSCLVICWLRHLILGLSL